MPGWFRFMTLLALKVFQEEKVDCAVVEVGIGGRTDATNVLPLPVMIHILFLCHSMILKVLIMQTVCGVTLLDYDHVELLGNTLRDIAFEKSGIFKVCDLVW